jgi:glycosyltransferase involved in cell wall biosynthesis
LKYFCDVKRFDKVINVDVVFPVIYAKNDYLVDVTRNIPFVYWIPDFQELYMPELFNSVDLQFRIDCCRKISSQKNKVVFSSVSVLNDYLKQYPEYNTINHVFHFSVFHPNIKTIEIEGLCVNKNIPSKYFFCANQFWQHKNHLTLFKALLQVKAVRNDIVVAFSGNENDERNKDYITILKTFISEHDLYTNVRFLGFIERTEQIALLSNAVAVIQPSLFEGWSTVVEDCKAQNQFVILSDIPVHREQMKNNVCFFNPIDSCALAENMIQIWDKRPQIEKGNYSFDQKKSGERFISIIKNLC